MLRRFCFAVSAFAAMLVFANVAAGLSCKGITVREALAKADVVFRGTVIDIHDAKRDALTDIIQPRKLIAVFRVSTVWKGEVGETVEIPLPQGTYPDWGAFASIGSELLVYARKSPNGNEYTTSICFLTKSAKNAVADFQELGPGKPPTDKGKPNSPTP